MLWFRTAEMVELSLGGRRLTVKDYRCAPDGLGLPKEKPGLWLYVQVTDQCPARCPFCANGSDVPRPRSALRPEAFGRTLREIRGVVAGVSLTGGEPLLEPERMEELIDAVRGELPDEIELDLATNGMDLPRLLRLRGLERFTTLHISRHAVDDARNSRLMGWSAPGEEEIRAFVGALRDPGAVVFNCVMQRGGVRELADVAAYLEMAGRAGVRNSGFIGFFPANEFCRENYVSPANLNFDADARFHIWNRQRDRDFCACASGSYDALGGPVRFYIRCPGQAPAPYCRQLVYTADNRLLDGFGGAEIPI